LEDTITAVGGTVFAASTGGTIEGVTIIALFLGISDVITAPGSNAFETAGIWAHVTVVSSVIACLLRVLHTITTNGQFAVQSASIGGGVAVQGSVIALFEGIDEVGLIVTTFPFADGRAAIKVVDIAIIALLARVDNTITAGGEAASGSANTRNVLVSSSKIALFTEVNNTVTTSGLLAVCSAAVGGAIGSGAVAVSDTVVTLLGHSNSSGHGFNTGVVFPSSVSAAAVRELREIIDE